MNFTAPLPTTAVAVFRPRHPVRFEPPGDPGRPSPSFRYAGIKRSAWTRWVAAFISAGLHAFLLLGFSQRPAYHRSPMVAEPPGELLMMEDLKEPEEEEPRELVDQDLAEPAVQVPTLADIPVNITVNADFTQLIDTMIPVKIDASALNRQTIPLHIQHGRPDLSGIKNLFNIAELDRKPEALVQPAPVFPIELKESFPEAQVRVGFVVTAKGDVIMAYIITSSHRGFERAALDAVAKWKFKPGMKNGRKVNTHVEQPIGFKVIANS